MSNAEIVQKPHFGTPKQSISNHVDSITCGSAGRGVSEPGKLTVGVFVLALGAMAFAAAQTISGQLIDQICYKMNKSNTGVDHKMPSGDEANCAATCAKMGQPVALLTSDGKVYTVTGDLAANNNAKLLPHLSHKAYR